MKLPEQPKEPLKATPLFAVPLPAGQNISLASLNFDISGGKPPYSLEWYKDNQPIPNWNLAVIQTGKGNSYALRVTDKNQCHVSTEVNLKVTSNEPSLGESSILEMYPTLVKDHFKVLYNGSGRFDATVTIVDMQGTVRTKISVANNSIVPVNLPAGIYLVYVSGENTSLIRKIIVTN